MSKEEIVFDGDFTTHADEDGMGIELKDVYAAMDKYAKEVAIGFYLFMENWQQMGAMGYTKRLTKEDMEKLDAWPDLDTLEWFTFDQLLTIYLNSINKGE